MGERSPVTLIVDDEPSVSDVIRSTLQRHGFKVLEAVGVEDAVRVAAKYDGPIDLIVANHKLRDGVGREAIDRIKEQRPEVRVLRYSGYPHEELQRTGDIGPEAAFIQKPFRSDQFIAKVRDVLGWLPERRRTAGDGES